MARVRPGVEETFASFEPSSLLISDDLPTLERPRKATSGAPPVRASVGKWSGLVAESRNSGKKRIVYQVSISVRYNQGFES